MTPTQRQGTSVPRIAAVLFALLVAACATKEINQDASLIERIQNASTRADHMSLADQYEREAKSARQKADEHRRMQEAYRGRIGGRRPESQLSLLRHCADLITQYERAALEYDGLILLHRQIANDAK